MNLLLKSTAAALMLTVSSVISLSPALAQETEAPDWAVEACTNEISQYDISVTDITEVITGKGGATLTMEGYNAAGIPVTFVCTYTIDTDEVVIEYQ